MCTPEDDLGLNMTVRICKCMRRALGVGATCGTPYCSRMRSLQLGSLPCQLACLPPFSV